MNPSDYIALAALTISLLVGYLNYRFTKRTFESSTFPAVSCDLELKETAVGSRIQASVHNLSDAKYIGQVRIVAKVSRSKHFFWNKKRTAIFNEMTAINKIQPTQSVEIYLTPPKVNKFPLLTFERCIKNVFPNKLRPIIQYYQQHPQKVERVFFEINDPSALYVLLKLTYVPGVYNTKNVTITQRYRIQPMNENTGLKESELLKCWSVDRIN